MLSPVTIPTPVSSIAQALLNFVYPPHCCACRGAIATAGDILCTDCRRQISCQHGARCWRCSCPSHRSVESCHHCSSWQDIPERVLVMAPFDRGAQTAIHALKFGRKRQLGEELGHIFADLPAFTADFAQIDLLVPVPLHPSRQRERGYNQSELVARGIARQLDKPLRCDIICRSRATAQQATLDAASRLDNLHEAFEVTANPDPGARIGLVDDVVTTAATMGSCAQALLSAGVAAVWGVALASPFSGMEGSHGTPPP